MDIPAYIGRKQQTREIFALASKARNYIGLLLENIRPVPGGATTRTFGKSLH